MMLAFLKGAALENRFFWRLQGPTPASTLKKTEKNILAPSTNLQQQSAQGKRK
jgi:hypothetical protein